MIYPPQPRPGRTSDFQVTTQLLHGPGVVARLPEVVNAMGATSAVLVSDTALLRAGHVRRVESLLHQAGVKVHTFSDTCENPTDSDVQAAVKIISPWLSSNVDRPVVIALGGGSVIDTAKGATLIASVGGTMSAHRGWMRATDANLSLPSIVAIPTTAGTGSEVQSYALVRDDASKRKMACGLPGLCPTVAILDAELTLSCPLGATIFAGLDALTHAIETSVCTARHAFSLAMSHRAFALIRRSFETVVKCPDDLLARHDMLMGSCLAGLAIEHAMLGAAHALANPLSALFDVTHGRAVGLMLPAVIRFNAGDATAATGYRELWPGHDALALAQWVEEVLTLAGQPRCLSAVGVRETHLPALTEQALEQWTLQFNPRMMGCDEVMQVYRSVL